MSAELLDPDEIKSLMKKVPEWELEDKSITRTYEFDEFMEGIDFVNGVAEIADEAGHHPDIDVRWTNVTLSLTSHSAGGLTDADFDLARKIDTLVE